MLFVFGSLASDILRHSTCSCATWNLPQAIAEWLLDVLTVCNVSSDLLLLGYDSRQLRPSADRTVCRTSTNDTSKPDGQAVSPFPTRCHQSEVMIRFRKVYRVWSNFMQVLKEDKMRMLVTCIPDPAHSRANPDYQRIGSKMVFS